MSNSALVIGVVVVAIFVVIAIALIVKSQRSQRLKSRFGPEYNRAVEETGSKTQAEAKLEKLAKRVRSFKINELSPTARADSISAWQKIQGRFVDDPKSALAEADKLIQKIMTARGYPITELRAADLSVDHPLIVEHYRAGHDIAVRHSQGRASTEDMRQTMIHYRTLFGELAGEPDLTRSTSAGGARA
jgi:hypothetical protein